MAIINENENKMEMPVKNAAMKTEDFMLSLRYVRKILKNENSRKSNAHTLLAIFWASMKTLVIHKNNITARYFLPGKISCNVNMAIKQYEHINSSNIFANTAK
jgi:hypothetical protein